MSCKTVTLEQHCIEYKHEDGRLLAKDVYVNVNTGEHGHHWVDVTNWGILKILIWLGY